MNDTSLAKTPKATRKTVKPNTIHQQPRTDNRIVAHHYGKANTPYTHATGERPML